METIKIGFIEWTLKNIDHLLKRDGSNLPVAKSLKEWVDYCNSKEPCAAAYDFNDKNQKNMVYYTILLQFMRLKNGYLMDGEFQHEMTGKIFLPLAEAIYQKTNTLKVNYCIKSNP